MDKECMDSACSLSGTQILGKTLMTQLGAYIVKVCGIGVHSVSRVRTGAESGRSNVSSVNVSELKHDDFVIGSKDKGPAKSSAKNDPRLFLQRLETWFRLYFTDPVQFEKSFPSPIPICTPNATAFQKEVWITLQSQVPVGSTVSYGELANLVNRPRAARAIGTAMKINPNCIIVPCHRVVKASSDIGNYNGGVEIKTWLLDHERKMKAKNSNPALSA